MEQVVLTKTEGTISWSMTRPEFTFQKPLQTKDERANMVYAIKVEVPNEGKFKIGMYGEITSCRLMRYAPKHIEKPTNKGAFNRVDQVSFKSEKGELFGLNRTDGSRKTSISACSPRVLIPWWRIATVNGLDVVTD